MKTHVVHARSAPSQPPASKPGQVPRNPHVVFPSDSERAMAERFVRAPVPVGAGPRMGFARSLVGKKRRQEAEEVRPEGEQGRSPRILHVRAPHQDCNEMAEVRRGTPITRSSDPWVVLPQCRVDRHLQRYSSAECSESRRTSLGTMHPLPPYFSRPSSARTPQPPSPRLPLLVFAAHSPLRFARPL